MPIDSKLLKLAEEIRVEMYSYSVEAEKIIQTNDAFYLSSTLRMFSIDAFSGSVSSVRDESIIALAGCVRALLETYVDSALLASSENKLESIKQFHLYSDIERFRFKRMQDPKVKPDPAEEKARSHFKVIPEPPKRPNAIYKHWSKIDSLEERLIKLQENDLYDIYRVASLATHGSPAFDSVYRSEKLGKICGDLFAAGLKFSVYTFGKCLLIGEIEDGPIVSSFERMLGILQRVKYECVTK